MSPLTPTHETAEQPPPSRPGPVHPGSTTAAATDHQPSNYPPPPAVLSHANHPHRPQTIAPPPPVPLDFENNPDAIALKSAISILQMQSRRAADDIRTLNKAKQDALEHPEEFISDLTAVVAPSSKREQEQADDDNSSSSSDDEDASGQNSNIARAWKTLPTPQNVVRCPPINWSQYAVVGDSLDRLHREQVARPPQTSPAVYTPTGGYEFKGTPAAPAEEYKGVAAPYNPLKDHIEKTPRPRK
jgi:hypothetical protein